MPIENLNLDARTPVHDLIAEQSVLGGMLLSAAVIPDVISEMQGRDFYAPKHEVIFDAIMALRDRGEPTDAIAVTDELARSGSESRAGSRAYVFELTSVPPTAANAGYYASVVHRHAAKRRLSEAGIRLAQMGYSSEGEVSDLIAAARRELDAVSGELRTDVRMVGDILPGVLAKLTEKATFVPSPWPTLNAAIGGFRPGAVYVIAARPGVGKTVIAAQIAAALAERGDVAFSSLEMSEDELVSRLISERLLVRVDRIKDNRLTPSDWVTIESRKQELLDLRVAIDDRASVSALDVRAHADAVAAAGSLAGVVVDYMQLMSTQSRLDRHLQVSEFSRQLKVMAKELRVPVIALSQLNRKSEDRADREPRLSDLRESGSIEQDADVVILLRRSEEKGRNSGIPRESLILDVAKNRHGETGEVELAWQGEFSRAIEWNE